MFEFQLVTDDDLRRFELMNRARYVPSGCWEWQAGKRAGYGQFSRGNKTAGAHRYAYEAFNGPIPDGMVVRHTCDNPGCINPDHLVIGTMADNVADREERGRRDVRGEQIGTAKLTETQVREIFGQPDEKLSVLAEQYGVSVHAIWSIRHGKSWAHVTASTNSMEAEHGR